MSGVRNDDSGDRSQVTGHGFSTETLGATAGIKGLDQRLAPSDWQLALSRRPTTDDRRLVHLIRTILNETSLEKLRIQFRRAHGLDRRTHRTRGDVSAHRQACARTHAIGQRRRVAAHASQISSVALSREDREDSRSHAGAAIGADVMVGFPGETEAEFEETRRMIEDLPFTYLHVFTYSARPGTPAAGMPEQVPVRIARERNAILRELGGQKKLTFMRTFVGQTLEAITLTSRCGADAPVREVGEADVTEALTDNYLKLQLQGKFEPNLWLRARIVAAENQMLIGRPA